MLYSSTVCYDNGSFLAPQKMRSWRLARIARSRVRLNGSIVSVEPLYIGVFSFRKTDKTSRQPLFWGVARKNRAKKFGKSCHAIKLKQRSSNIMSRKNVIKLGSALSQVKIGCVASKVRIGNALETKKQ